VAAGPCRDRGRLHGIATAAPGNPARGSAFFGQAVTHGPPKEDCHMTHRMMKITTVAILAGMPALSFAQAPAQPARPSTPPAASAPSTMPQAGTTAPRTGMANAATDARRASNIIGANIVNEENNTIGEVHDLMVSPNGGPVTAVLSVGGFLGIGERYVAMPISELRWNGERERWMLPGATVDSLKARPAYSYPDRS
jgi:hypothetical protein